MQHLSLIHIYNNPVAKSEEKKAKAMLKQLYFYYMEHIEELPQKYLAMLGPVSYTHLFQWENAAAAELAARYVLGKRYGGPEYEMQYDKTCLLYTSRCV